MKSVKLGQVVKDKITGFKGVAVAVCRYINGCTQVEIQPQVLKDSFPVKSAWIDIQQLETVKKTKEPFDEAGTYRERRGRPGKGGPGDYPPKRHPDPAMDTEEIPTHFYAKNG
jgi:hypothetical protein